MGFGVSLILIAVGAILYWAVSQNSNILSVSASFICYYSLILGLRAIQ
jgi:hypothetical protein